MSAVRRHPVLGATIAIVVAIGAWSGFHIYRGATAGRGAEGALLRVEVDVNRRNLPAARSDLGRATGGFRRARSELRALGPVLTVARHVPLVRTQVRGAEQFAEAGLALTASGGRLVDSAATILAPPDQKLPVSAALGELQATQKALQAGIASLDGAIARVSSLNGDRLLGPLGSARNELTTKLPQVRARAASANDGLGALIAFAGASGPRHYLVFSQNPDEVRPTGGFIGTYGVLSADAGHLALDRYDSIESWYAHRPDVVVAPDKAGSPFRLDTLLGPQTIANVNNVPDWPADARSAMDLWQRGGEQPVDGVLSLSTGFLVRALAAVGPVTVPDYNETVTAANAVARINFHVHESAADAATGNRKEFVAVLAEAVLRKVLDAPATKWDALARAAGAAFDARELMLWSNDPVVQDQLGVRRWDGTLPSTVGDFFYQGDFEYAAKNGRDVKRTYDHRVAVRPDGSARITTTVTITNTQPDTPESVDSLSYVTLYGPAGSTRVDGGDEPASVEPSLGNHPAWGWFASAAPGDPATITVAWDAPNVAHRLPDGTWAYGLYWMRVPDHAGDEVQVHVDLPKDWHWKGGAPPERAKLDKDLVGVWSLSVPKAG